MVCRGRHILCKMEEAAVHRLVQLYVTPLQTAIVDLQRQNHELKRKQQEHENANPPKRKRLPPAAELEFLQAFLQRCPNTDQGFLWAPRCERQRSEMSVPLAWLRAQYNRFRRDEKQCSDDISDYRFKTLLGTCGFDVVAVQARRADADKTEPKQNVVVGLRRWAAHVHVGVCRCPPKQDCVCHHESHG